MSTTVEIGRIFALKKTPIPYDQVREAIGKTRWAVWYYEEEIRTAFNINGDRNLTEVDWVVR